MKSYTWPGNVRQFKSIILSLFATHRGELVMESDILTSLQHQPEIEHPNFGINNEKLSHSAENYLKAHFDFYGGVLPASGLYARIIAEVEKPLLKLALQATRGNQAKCAKMLGINRNTLRKKISEQKLDKK
jgi:two-component system nitrogen regulation response regulator GlnG